MYVCRQRKNRAGHSCTCFLWSNDEELGESVTGLFFRPDIFVSLVMTRVLKNKNLFHLFITSSVDVFALYLKESQVKYVLTLPDSVCNIHRWDLKEGV